MPVNKLPASVVYSQTTNIFKNSIDRLREKTKIFDQKNEIEAWKNKKNKNL